MTRDHSHDSPAQGTLQCLEARGQHRNRPFSWPHFLRLMVMATSPSSCTLTVFPLLTWSGNRTECPVCARLLEARARMVARMVTRVSMFSVGSPGTTELGIQPRPLAITLDAWEIQCYA